MSVAFTTMLAVGTGVVVIVVAVAVVLLALLFSASMRGRRKRTEQARDAAREQAERRTDPDR